MVSVSVFLSYVGILISFIPTLEWKYQSVLYHRFEEDLETLRARFYCRHYTRHPASYPPCTDREMDRERAILHQWLRDEPEDDFEPEESEASSSVKSKETPPPQAHFPEPSMEPYSASSTPPSEPMVADSGSSSVSGGVHDEGHGSDIHMHSGTDDDRQSINTAGFVVPDDEDNAEHDDEAYPGSDKGGEGDDEDSVGDEAGNDERSAPAGNAVSVHLFSCLTSGLSSSLSVYTASSVTSSVPVLLEVRPVLFAAVLRCGAP